MIDERYLTPAQVMAYRFKQDPKPNWKIAILCFREYIGCEMITDFFQATPISGYKMFYGIDAHETQRQVFEAEVDGQKIGIITRLSWGGPQAAILVEELAFLGVETIIGYGAAGSIDATIRQGDLVIGIESLNSDGTSRSYLPEKRIFTCDQELLRIVREETELLKQPMKEVIAANVDGLYRETKALVKQFQAEGGQMVNMETSALYASAEICQVNSIWLGYISDCLVQEEWASWDIDSRVLSVQISQVCMNVVKHLVRTTAGNTTPLKG
ncbi:phosphorylase family protein [Paenibacillus sp. MMS18-CY102]|uniref:phosphorylase family protein n=1 Tax=Paenibacillus sp. MMS18-CY102 TaxID=2682849 RepID=UPI001F1C08F9|nr:hypothetical protein [Paenibacillus sp. MMS18-CY102]